MVAKLEPLAAPDRPFRAERARTAGAGGGAQGRPQARPRTVDGDHEGSPACRRAPQQRAAAMLSSLRRRRRPSRVMANALRAIDSPGPSSSSCSPCRFRLRRLRRLVRQEEAAAAGRAHRRSSPNAASIEPDKDMASVQVVLPAPTVNNSLAAVRRLRQLRHAAIWRSAIRRRSSGRPMSAPARARRAS